MPLATLPWWKSLAVMNENEGVFGLNMLMKWWDRQRCLTDSHPASLCSHGDER
jgi:hypothetical protein